MISFFEISFPIFAVGFPACTTVKILSFTDWLSLPWKSPQKYTLRTTSQKSFQNFLKFSSPTFWKFRNLLLSIFSCGERFHYRLSSQGHQFFRAHPQKNLSPWLWWVFIQIILVNAGLGTLDSSGIIKFVPNSLIFFEVADDVLYRVQDQDQVTYSETLQLIFRNGLSTFSGFCESEQSLCVTETV